MVDLWTLGGLSWRELLRRTWRESWEDAVFGQAARLAFYHFLAMFPSLLLLMFLFVKSSAASVAVRHTLADALGQIMPQRTAELVATTMNELAAHAHLGVDAITAGLSAAWAAVNGTWAMMSGLNTAYEVRERRSVGKVLATASGLTLAILVLLLASLAVILFGTQIAVAISKRLGSHESSVLIFHLVEWPVIALLLLFSFALLYRFGPNLSDREWKWSTPGAVLSLILWIACALLVRAYFDLFHSYDRVYSGMSAVAMLLLWLYVTGAAVLIGGELNSEIEKAVQRMDGSETKSEGRASASTRRSGE